VVDVASIGSPDVLGTDRVLVHPLALRGVARVPEHLKDLPAVDVGVAVFSQGAVEPTDSGGSRDRVEAESPD